MRLLSSCRLARAVGPRGWHSACAATGMFFSVITLRSAERRRAQTFYPVLQEFRKIFQPYSCDLHSMNATHFSKCLKGQRLIIIGDSTMRQVFQSLACLLVDHVEDGYLVVSPSSEALHGLPLGA